MVIINIYEARAISLLFMITLLWPRHWIRLIGKINEHIWTGIHHDVYTIGFMEQLYTYTTKRENVIMVIIHIYVATVTLLIIYDDLMLT